MKRKFKLYLLLGNLILITCLCIVGFTIAKYVDNLSDDDSNIETPEYYFTSDLLSSPDIANNIPIYNLNENVSSIKFNLLNYENSLMYSECDITYEVSILKDSVVLETKTGTILKDACNSSIIEFNNLESGEYRVVAMSTAPFLKQIEAIFVIKATDNSIQYIVDDKVGSPVVMLTILTNNYAGNISISWKNTISPDNTNPLLEDAIDLVLVDGFYTYKVPFEAYSSYVFVFYKELNSVVYTIDDFKVIKDN